MWLSGSELMITLERLKDMYDDVPEISSFSVLTSAHSNPLLALEVNNAKGSSSLLDCIRTLLPTEAPTFNSHIYTHTILSKIPHHLCPSLLYEVTQPPKANFKSPSSLMTVGIAFG